MHIKKMSEYHNESSPMDNEYPYGTQLMLSDEMVKELGIAELPAGASVNLKAVAFVKRKDTEEEAGEDAEIRFCLQLVELDVKAADTRDRVSMLYGDDNGK